MGYILILNLYFMGYRMDSPRQATYPELHKQYTEICANRFK